MSYIYFLFYYYRSCTKDKLIQIYPRFGTAARYTAMLVAQKVLKFCPLIFSTDYSPIDMIIVNPSVKLVFEEMCIKAPKIVPNLVCMVFSDVASFPKIRKWINSARRAA